MPETISASIGRFHVLTDFFYQQRFSHAQLARLAASGGADTIQFRQKLGGIRHVLTQAVETTEICRKLEIPVVIDDRVDVALACNAHGVHLGQNDFPVRAARSVLEPDAIIGATATTLDQALRAQDDGADYIGFGPVFPTTSKANPASVKGLDHLARVCAALDIPVIAIAGITSKRIERVMAAGAHGVAVMTAVTNAQDPALAAREIREALDASLGSLNVGSHSNGRSKTGG